MKTLPEILRDADPLSDEPARSAAERRAARNTILSSRTAAIGVSRRPPLAMVAVVALMLIGIAAGWRNWPGGAADVIAAVRFEVRLAEEAPTLGLRPVTVAGTARTIYLHTEPVVTNSDIAQARVVEGDDGTTFSISVTFTPGGAAKMSRATAGHLGKPVAILLDGEVVLAPTVRSRMSNAAMLTGSYTKAEVERIVRGIIGR